MESRTATRLAWSMCLVAAAAMVGTLAVDFLASSLDAFTILGVPSILAFSLVGALVASRRQDNPIGWIPCGVGLSFALGGSVEVSSAGSETKILGHVPAPEYTS